MDPAEQSDISNSPAFTFLDELQAAGKLTASQVQLYRSKYSKLHEVVLKTYDDIQRMQRAGKVRGALNAPTAQQLFPQVPWVTARLRMQ